MLWHVADTRAPRELLLLLLPRQQPPDAAARDAWLASAQRAVKIEHPGLALPEDIGFTETWPYLAYARGAGLTMSERLVRQRATQTQLAAEWLRAAAEGLAAAHDAGWLFVDLQPFHLLLVDDGRAQLIGLGLLGEPGLARARHQAGVESETLCLGLLANRLLGGRPPLETTDTHEALLRMPPLGREFVRLGFEATHPIDEALRAIVNRSTATAPGQRYHSARPLARALDGWLDRSRHPDGGTAAQLVERIQRFGVLPVSRGEAVRSVAAGGLERQHTGAMAALVQQDAALSLELLRRVNLARQQQGGGAADGVLSLSRAIAMLGQLQVSQIAAGLRPWPGVLAPERVLGLRLALARTLKAADVAIPLAPAGYDPEVLRLTALLQNLGRLLLNYHLSDEAEQVQGLMKPPEPTEEQPHPQGLSERQAAFSVLGCDLDTLAAAAIRQLGLGEEAQQLALRPEPDAPIHPPQGDLEALRLTCALANELVDAVAQPEPRRRQMLDAATRRFARALGLSGRDIQLALFPEAAQAQMQMQARRQATLT